MQRGASPKKILIIFLKKECFANFLMNSFSLPIHCIGSIELRERVEKYNMGVIAGQK